MADGRLIFDTEINTQGFESDLNNLEAKTNSTSGGITKGILGAEIIKKAAVEVVEFGNESLKTASHLQEVQNVIDTTFGENSSSIYEFGAAAKKNYGIAEAAALDYAGQFGSLFKTAGLADEQVLQYTKDLVGLGADLASFWDIDIETALTRISSALAGETEAIEKFGIDIRTAALSDFAGYDVTGLSRAEQISLIYQKLMADTTQIQGDFQKTQDSFANQMKILETNIASLQAALGDGLLPIVNTFVSAVNDIFEGGEENPTEEKLKSVADQWQAFSDTVMASNEQFTQSQEKITAMAELAEGYLSTLESLEGKQLKTEDDIYAIQNAIAALNTMYPQLQLYFDPATGKINENTEAIRNNIAALQTLSVQKLFSEQQSANAEAYAQALDNLAGAQLALEEAEAPVEALQRQVDGINGLTAQLEKNDFQGIDAYYGQFADLINGFDQYFTQNPDGSWSAIEGMMPDIGQITNAAQNALITLNIQREQLLQGVADAQAAVDGYNASIEAIFAQQSEIETKQAKVLELMNGAGQEATSEFASGVSDSTGTAQSAVSIMTSEAAGAASLRDYFTAGANAAKNYVAGLKSVSIPVLQAKTSGGGTNTDGKHATGLDRVPYDNYLASLHVGEAVLTAAEAKQWRSGKSGIDTAALAASISAAITTTENSRPVVINVNGKTVAQIMAADNAKAANSYNRGIALGVGKR